MVMARKLSFSNIDLSLPPNEYALSMASRYWLPDRELSIFKEDKTAKKILAVIPKPTIEKMFTPLRGLRKWRSRPC